MADDANRAAKAARAKAMLKKRQQQQKLGGAITPSASPAPVERESTPGLVSPPPRLQEHVQQHRDAASLFGGPSSSAVDVDFGEFGVISPSPTRPTLPPPPPPIISPSPPALSPQWPPDQQLQTLVKNQQQTIALLVTEKASLLDQLEGYDDLRAKLGDTQTRLATVRTIAETVPALKKDMGDVKLHLERVEEKERAANDKARDMEHALSGARLAESETKKKLVEVERELRELKEDDRGEMLERSLDASRGRVEELEARVGKLVLTLDTTTTDHNNLKTELSALHATHTLTTTQFSTLTAEHSSLHSSHAILQSTLDAAEHARASLEAALAVSESTLTSLQDQLASTTRDLATHSRHLHDVRAVAEDSYRHATQSDDAVRALQSENTALVAQLGEIRPKLVELSNARAEDGEQFGRMERRAVKAEKETARLEGVVEELRAAKEEAEEVVLSEREEWAITDERHQGEVDQVKVELQDTQAAHAALSRELDEMRQKLLKADFENAAQRGTISTARQEVTRWRGEAELRASDIDSAKREIEDMRVKEEETLAVVERAQAEVEALRDQLALREDELARLRDEDDRSNSTTTSGSKPSPPQISRGHNLGDAMIPTTTGHHRTSSPHSRHRSGHSLSEEMERHNHTLDLSTAHSRIRALETALYDAEHSAERRIQALEVDLAQARVKTSFPRGSSFHDDPSSRRHSLNSTRPHTPSALRTSIRVRPRAVYDENLSAETRHKRKVSLSMLKTRIESERATSIGLGSPRTSLSHFPIREVDEGAKTPRSDGKPAGGRTAQVQVLDESHVFWCHSCSGDLVVL